MNADMSLLRASGIVMVVGLARRRENRTPLARCIARYSRTPRLERQIRRGGRVSGNPDIRVQNGAMLSLPRDQVRELLVERRARNAEKLGGEHLLALRCRERRADRAALG